MSTPIYPIMDNCYMDTYFFFVPCRLLWEHWENMFGENDTNYWAEKTEYSTPTCRFGTEKGIQNGSIGDYFGLPTKINKKIEVNALPARAYAMIYNEWFRDENLEAPLMLGYKKTDDAGESVNGEVDIANYANKPEKTTNTSEGVLYGMKPAKAGKFHDYFTSCLPSPMKSDPVEISLVGDAPVFGYNTIQDTAKITDKIILNQPWPANGTTDFLNTVKGGKLTGKGVLDGGNYTAEAYLKADLSATTATTINELRNAIAVQQYYEAMARGGSRYREQVQALWDVTISDKTVQIPE